MKFCFCILAVVASLAVRAAVGVCDATVRVDFSRAEGPIRPLNGVNNAPTSLGTNDSDRLVAFESAGIPFMRTHDTVGMWGGAHYVDIPNIFPDFDADENDPKNYDFTFTDRYLSNVVKAGTEVFFRLGVTIENYWRIKRYTTNPPKDFAKWARICEHVVRHYTERWADGYRWNIRYWEIWNEPDNPSMWSGTCEQFLDLYAVTATHLKKTFPHLKVGGFGSCGFYGLNHTERRGAAGAEWGFFEDFLKWYDALLARCRRDRVPLDFFSFHLYTDDPREHALHTAYAQKKLDEYGFTRTELINDEWNSMWLSDTWSEKSKCEAVGKETHAAAAYVAAVLAVMQRETTLSAAMFYDARPQSSYGTLFHANGKTAPAYEAFVAFDKLRRLGTSVAVTSSSSNVYVLAAKSERGPRGVLLANFSDADRQIRLKLNVADPFAVSRVDADHAKLVPTGETVKDGTTLALPRMGLAYLACDATVEPLVLRKGVEVVTVRDATRYNAWPMIQKAGDKLVCAYSGGFRHSIGDGDRGGYARVSLDGGTTWEPETLIANDPRWGELPESVGCDTDGAMLLWCMCSDDTRYHHDLYRTTDGKVWTRLASLRLDPHPTQIMDIQNVDGRLFSLWFRCAYGGGADNAWGTLESSDGGRTWKQTVVERLPSLKGLPTEQSIVHLGNGRFFGLTRTEGTQGELQIESKDCGKTWTKHMTNIRDVNCSTPAVVYDARSGLVYAYYYERGKGLLKCRIASLEKVSSDPGSWPEPEILVTDDPPPIPADCGNVKVVVDGDCHIVAYYTGRHSQTAIRICRVNRSAVGFDTAKPVWPAASDGLPNENIRFTAVFETDGAPVTLRATGATQYKIRLDGAVIGYGPARAPEGWARVSEIPLSLKDGRHELVFEVSAYNIRAMYSSFPQPGYLQAEVVAKDGRVLAATGRDGAFRATEITSRHRKTARFSSQRGFVECWTFPEQTGPVLALAERPAKRLTVRRAPEPDLSRLTPLQPIGTQAVRYDPNARTQRWFFVEGPYEKPDNGYPLAEHVWNASLHAQQFVALEKIRPVAAPSSPQRIETGRRVRYDAGADLTGFVHLRLKVLKPGKLWVNWSELLVRGKVDSFKMRNADVSVWEFTEPGDYEVETLEPYTFRYLEATTENGGVFEIASVAICRLESPELAAAKLPPMGDAELDEILAAARRTLAANTLDTFMDCPGRERAAWLCDAFFTAKGAFALTGNTKVEKDFLENWLLPDAFGDLPEGMLPMTYPSCAITGQFIPNWAMWYVLQLEDYLKRSGDRAFVDAMKPRLAKLLAFFRRYRNADGLLERLPSWVFIEWSEANAYVQDVNYPANMTWAGVLEAYGRMYGDAAATTEAAKVRKTIFDQSFDGAFFRDHAKRGADGSLAVMPECTETCQDYALYFRLGDRKTPGGWYATVVNRLGGVRPYGSKELPKISKSAPFIGDALRLLALADLGEWEILRRDLKAFYLQQARRTGTLWETEKEIHSNCHGFAGAAADLILRCDRLARGQTPVHMRGRFDAFEITPPQIGFLFRRRT